MMNINMPLFAMIQFFPFLYPYRVAHLKNRDILQKFARKIFKCIYLSFFIITKLFLQSESLLLFFRVPIGKKPAPVDHESIFLSIRIRICFLNVVFNFATRGVSSRWAKGAYVPDESNHGGGGYAPPLNRPLMKFEIVCFCP